MVFYLLSTRHGVASADIQGEEGRYVGSSFRQIDKSSKCLFLLGVTPNNVRLQSAIGYIAPADKLNARVQEIFKERDRKLEAAGELRKQKRQQNTPGFTRLTES